MQGIPPPPLAVKINDTIEQGHAMRFGMLAASCVLALISPATAQLTVYISADMEGIAGLSATDDPLGRRLMTAEVNAAVRGAFEGGATRVVVNDAHGSHANLLQDELDPRVTLLRGSLKPYGMVQGLDSTTNAVVFIGYHGRAGSSGSFAAHTGSGRVADVRVNGTSLGEGGLNTFFAAWYGVPVVFISGDAVAVEQIRTLVPTAEGVPVKQGIWNRAVQTMLPDSAQAAIQRGVASALRVRRARFIPPVEPPFEVEMEFTSHLYADIAEGIPGLRRMDYTTVAFTTDEFPAAYRMVRVLYKHLTP